MLQALAAREQPSITFGEISTGLRQRAFGLSLLIFALPCSLPMPPGIPTLAGIVIALIALNMILGRPRLWLPRMIAARTVRQADLRRLIERVLPYVRGVERYCRPRLAMAHERVGRTLIGLVVMILGVLLILPIPILGNIPPAIAVVVIAIGLSERDGVLLLIGMLCAAIAIALTSAAAWAAVEWLTRLAQTTPTQG